MYLRFITTFIDEWNEEQTGVFQALSHLIRDSETFEYDRGLLKELEKWFDKELKEPPRLNKHSNKHKAEIAISWFKDDATKYLKRMYELIPVFANYNIKVEVIKTENPGYKVYEDQFQIVSIPHGKDKARVL